MDVFSALSFCGCPAQSLMAIKQETVYIFWGHPIFNHHSQSHTLVLEYEVMGSITASLIRWRLALERRDTNDPHSKCATPTYLNRDRFWGRDPDLRTENLVNTTLLNDGL